MLHVASFPGPARVRRLQYEQQYLLANFVLQATNAQGPGTRLCYTPVLKFSNVLINMTTHGNIRSPLRHQFACVYAFVLCGLDA